MVTKIFRYDRSNIMLLLNDDEVDAIALPTAVKKVGWGGQNVSKSDDVILGWSLDVFTILNEKHFGAFTIHILSTGCPSFLRSPIWICLQQTNLLGDFTQPSPSTRWTPSIQLGFRTAYFLPKVWPKIRKLRNQKICQFEPTLKSSLFSGSNF